jgi:hypothetical protein
VNPADAVVAFFHAVDDCDWMAIRAGLADDLEVDYSSLFGGDPERLAAEALIERWQGLLPGFDVTQHLLGPLLVIGERVECNVRAYHHLGRQTWMVAGRYTLALAGSRIAGIVLHTKYEDGDRALTQEAAKRAG